VNLTPGSDDDGWIVPPPIQLKDGTAVQLLKDGEALHAAYRAIGAARQTICLEIYIFRSDTTGRTFAELLARRASQGLAVRVVYDSFGSMDADREMFESMRRAGVRAREFHPWHPWRCKHGWRIFNRDHRKLLVVDGDQAVLGGQNLANEYGGSAISQELKEQPWRDTAIGLHGPSVHKLSDAFFRIWEYTERGGPIRRAEYFSGTDSHRPDFDLPEDSLAVLASVPSPRSPLLTHFRRLLRGARESLDMTMAYFAPPEELVEQLGRCAQRGVRVRLMLPGRSDVGILRIAARAFYNKLMDAGVEIYERQHAVLHAKTLCVDGRISIVGSTNLDYRSIQYNCELSSLIHSKPFGAQMNALFEHDICFARSIRADEWRHRPLRDRLVQSMVMRARYLL
jgi:cardiolipin synthase